MKKTFVTLFLVGILFAAVTSPAAAQSSGAAVVKVPFEFIAGDTVLSAGHYRIQTQANDWSVVMITSLDKPVAVFASTRSVADSVPDGKDPQLSFTKYHGHYFLQQIALPGRSARVVMTKDEAEQVLAKLNLLPNERGEPAK